MKPYHRYICIGKSIVCIGLGTIPHFKYPSTGVLGTEKGGTTVIANTLSNTPNGNRLNFFLCRNTKHPTTLIFEELNEMRVKQHMFFC